MSKRAGNLERISPEERDWLTMNNVENFLITEGELCPYCRDLDCAGRGEKAACASWPLTTL